MKEITIQVTDELIKEIGNAIAAYGQVFWSISLGLNPGNKFSDLLDLSDEEMRQKMLLLKNFHSEISK